MPKFKQKAYIKHTYFKSIFTRFSGDSFYIPPKNYYNLINNKAREAELSLLQYQYSGPLPSVPAGSQSGQTPNGVAQS